VGRSVYQSYCFVLTNDSNPKTTARLQALVTAKDGFELAEYDLQFRGPGEIYGLKQSGWLDFRLAKLTDHELIAQAKTAAEDIVSKDKGLSSHPLLKQKMEQFLATVHFE